CSISSTGNTTVESDCAARACLIGSGQVPLTEVKGKVNVSCGPPGFAGAATVGAVGAAGAAGLEMVQGTDGVGWNGLAGGVWDGPGVDVGLSAAGAGMAIDGDDLIGVSWTGAAGVACGAGCPGIGRRGVAVGVVGDG